MSLGAELSRHFEEHVGVVTATASELLSQIETYARWTLDVVDAGGTLFFAGNGGSAADAQHLAAEYVVRFARARRAVAAVALTTDTSVLTAAGNDLGFDQIFARQVEALGSPADLLILHSSSGASRNLVAAAEVARSRGMRVVGVLARDGGALAGAVDLALIVPTDSTARAQEVHLLIGHAVCDAVDRAVEAG